MNVDTLFKTLDGVHGTGLDVIDPITRPYEGMREVELLTDGANFKLKTENEVPNIYLSVPGSDKDHKVHYEGYKKIMRLCGFPENVVDKYPIEMMLEPLNWGVQNKLPEAIKAFVNRDGVVAFVKPNLQLVSYHSLIQRMYNIAAEMCPDGVTPLFERLDHTLQYTNCSMLVPFKGKDFYDERLENMLEPGTHRRLGENNEIMVGGVNFQGSIMGESPLEISSYIYRLVCSNGLLSAETKFKWSRKTESTPLMDWFDERVRASIEGLDHEYEKIDNLRNIQIPEGHRAQVLSNIFQEYELSDKIRTAVLERMADAPPRHMWDVVNAITNVANDEEYKDNPHTIRRLQVVGGDMSSKVHVCQTCFSVSR